MGDFDRKQTTAPSGSQSKQIFVLAGLGLVLIGVVGYHFLSKGPQPAVAVAGGMGAIPVPVLEETPEQASDALRQDPTAALLRPKIAVDVSLDKVPRNPFLMGEAWRSSLIQQGEEAPPAVVASPTEVAPRPKVIPVPKAEDFKLGSTIRQGGGYLAVLNGRIVSVGAVVGEARVVEIQEGRVVLQHADHANGPKIEVTMEPKLK